LRLQEILDQQSAIRAELAQLEDSTSTTEEDAGDYADSLMAKYDELEGKRRPIVERMQKLNLIKLAADDPANLEPPPGDDSASGNGGAWRNGTPDLVARNKRDPFDDATIAEIRRGSERNPGGMIATSELRERAFDAVEFWSKRELSHDHAEAATRMVQNNPGYGGRGIAAHLLNTGTPEYADTFREYLARPEAMASRAALSLTSANGGYLLPFVLDPTIILTNASSANPWRRIARNVQTTSNTWNGVNSAGVNAAMLSEATVVVDASPTVLNIVITPQKATAWVYGSYEVLEDTDFGQQLPALLADAKDRLEESQFATGTGTPPQTVGIIPAATTVVTTAVTTVIALGDIYAVHGALPARFRNAPGCAWVANVAIINKIRQLDTAGGSSFWTNLGKGQPETLLGAPIYESTTMTASVATTSLEAIFGDFGQYIICDRVGVSMIYEPLVKASGGNLPTGQAGWFMFWRFGANLSTVNAFRVMKGL
jgi:HK97 family phage major capsid protein